LTAVFIVVTRFAGVLAYRYGVRLMLTLGALVSAVGMGLLTTVGVTSTFTTRVLPAELVLGLGLCVLFVPLGSAALIGVEDHDAGAASAVFNTTQQVGPALGIALFGTIYASATTGSGSHGLGGGQLDPLTQVHGYVATFQAAAIGMLASALIAGLFVRARRSEFGGEKPAQTVH
jgi:MFS family permease